MPAQRVNGQKPIQLDSRLSEVIALVAIQTQSPMNWCRLRRFFSIYRQTSHETCELWARPRMHNRAAVGCCGNILGDNLRRDKTWMQASPRLQSDRPRHRLNRVLESFAPQLTAARLSCRKSPSDIASPHHCPAG